MDEIQRLPDVDLDVDDVRDSQGRCITHEHVEAAVAEALAAVGRTSPR